MVLTELRYVVDEKFEPDLEDNSEEEEDKKTKEKENDKASDDSDRGSKVRVSRSGASPPTTTAASTSAITNTYENKHRVEQDISEEEDSDSKEKRYSYPYLCTIFIEYKNDWAAIEKAYEGCEYKIEHRTAFYHMVRHFEPGEVETLKKTLNLSEEQKADRTYQKTYRLKFHISLPEDDSKVNSTLSKNDRTYYEKGWDIIQKILRKHRVYHFKVADNQTRMSIRDNLNDPDQSGKDITVYSDEQKGTFISIRDWLVIMREITKELIKNEIPPGLRPVNKGERPVRYLEGNSYVFHRYDCDENKKVLPPPEPDLVQKTWAELNEQLSYDTSTEEERSENHRCQCKLM